MRTAAYQALDAYSASFIASVGKRMNGILDQPEGEGKSLAQTFGADFHTLLLEPHLYGKGDNPEIKKLVDAIRANATLNRILNDPFVQVEQEYHKVIYGRKFKGILDTKVGRLGLDFKSTVCQDLASFIGSLTVWDYWLQARIYMKLADLEDFYFIGVQKNKKKPKVFFVSVKDYPVELQTSDEIIRKRIKWHEQHPA